MTASMPGTMSTSRPRGCGNSITPNSKVAIAIPTITACLAVRRTNSKCFHDHRNALPTTDTGRRQPVFLLAAAQFVEQRDHQSRAGRAQRVTQRDGAAIDVDLLAIQP